MRFEEYLGCSRTLVTLRIAVGGALASDEVYHGTIDAASNNDTHLHIPYLELWNQIWHASHLMNAIYIMRTQDKPTYHSPTSLDRSHSDVRRAKQSSEWTRLADLFNLN